jgi:hypothetical protein
VLNFAHFCMKEHALSYAPFRKSTYVQISVLTSIASFVHSRTVRNMARTLLTCGTLDQETREEPIDGMMLATMMQ